MTPTERRKPDLLNASRKRRIAAGSGVDVAEVNRLLKQHRQMADAFKMMSRGGGKNMLRMAQAMGLGGGPGLGGPGLGGMGGAMPGLPKGVTPPGGMMGGMGGGGLDLDMLKALGGGKPTGGGGAEPELPVGLQDLMKGLGGALPPGFGGLPKKK